MCACCVEVDRFAQTGFVSDCIKCIAHVNMCSIMFRFCGCIFETVSVTLSAQSLSLRDLNHKICICFYELKDKSVIFMSQMLSCLALVLLLHSLMMAFLEDPFPLQWCLVKHTMRATTVRATFSNQRKHSFILSMEKDKKDFLSIVYPKLVNNEQLGKIKVIVINDSIIM